jgi:hypothetical protein
MKSKLTKTKKDDKNVFITGTIEVAKKSYFINSIEKENPNQISEEWDEKSSNKSNKDVNQI